MEQPFDLHGQDHFCSHDINITDAAVPTATSLRSATVAPTSALMTVSSTPPQSPQSSDSSSSSNKLPLAVGLGVGIPLGFAAAVGLAWVLLHPRKHSRHILEMSSADAMYKRSGSGGLASNAHSRELGSGRNNDRAHVKYLDGLDELEGGWEVQELEGVVREYMRSECVPTLM
jgi:hypothetical protein